MLHNAHSLTHEVQMRIEFNGTLGREGTQLLADLQEMIAIPLVALQSWSRGEVASPVGMWIRCIWEKVVGLCGPCAAGIVQGLQIARWSGVQQVYF